MSFVVWRRFNNQRSLGLANSRDNSDLPGPDCPSSYFYFIVVLHNCTQNFTLNAEIKACIKLLWNRQKCSHNNPGAAIETHMAWQSHEVVCSSRIISRHQIPTGLTWATADLLSVRFWLHRSMTRCSGWQSARWEHFMSTQDGAESHDIDRQSVSRSKCSEVHCETVSPIVSETDTVAIGFPACFFFLSPGSLSFASFISLLSHMS